VKAFSKRVEETGPKNVEAKKEIQVGAAAITTHRVPELNLLAASTWMAFLSLRPPHAARRRRSAKRAKECGTHACIGPCSSTAALHVSERKRAGPPERPSRAPVHWWYGHAFTHGALSSRVRPLPSGTGV
jgi:hypothetical protein